MGKISNKITRYKECCHQNGKRLTFLIYYHKFKRKIFNRFCLGRSDTCIDSSSQLLGLKNIIIGTGFQTGKHFRLEAVTEYNGIKYLPRIIIGDNVSFSDFGHVGATHYIKIGDNVLFGSKCYVTDHNHGNYRGDHASSPEIPPTKRNLTVDQKVIIEDNVWVGDGVTILPGVTIGRCAIIGTNAVVTKNIPPYTICVGIPAKPIKKWDFEKKVWIKY